MDIKKETIKLHEKIKGKIEIKPKIKVTKDNLKLLYTPGVAEISKLIAERKSNSYVYTGKGNRIAIISDGTRLLGLGNIGAEAAIPVMESKALLYKEYGNVDAFPICIKTQDRDEIIKIVENIAVNFGAINIEDIESPKCFEIVDELTRRLDIPIFHDDQHGTAMVTLAGLMNALKVVKKDLRKVKIIIAGAGAAGYGITKLLVHCGAKKIYVLDKGGVVNKNRKDMNNYKRHIARITNYENKSGSISELISDADVFIGVCGKKDFLSESMVKSMRKDSIVFALSNPDPEISPEKAKEAGAKIIATGRSDYPNQINNSVVFPFFMRKLLDERILNISEELLFKTAKIIADKVKKPTESKIIPNLNEVYK